MFAQLIDEVLQGYNLYWQRRLSAQSNLVSRGDQSIELAPKQA